MTARQLLTRIKDELWAERRRVGPECFDVGDVMPIIEKALEEIKSSVPKIDLVSSVEGDWEGLFVDGKLKAKGHSLDARDVIEALGFRVNSFNERYFSWKML